MGKQETKAMSWLTAGLFAVGVWGCDSDDPGNMPDAAELSVDAADQRIDALAGTWNGCGIEFVEGVPDTADFVKRWQIGGSDIHFTNTRWSSRDRTCTGTELNLGREWTATFVLGNSVSTTLSGMANVRAPAKSKLSSNAVTTMSSSSSLVGFSG